MGEACSPPVTLLGGGCSALTFDQASAGRHRSDTNLKQTGFYTKNILCVVASRDKKQRPIHFHARANCSHLDSSPDLALKSSTCGTTSHTAGAGHLGFAEMSPSLLHHCKAQGAQLNLLLGVALF